MNDILRGLRESMFRRTFFVLLVGLLVVITGSNTLPAVAAQAGQGLEVTKPLYDLRTDPGQDVKFRVKVRNITTDTLLIKTQYEDFVADGEDGAPKILQGSSEKSPYSIKDWIESIPSVTLKPGQQVPIIVTLNVPSNASPGGHYGVIRFTGTPPEIADTGVSLSASVGSLILVNVSGKTTESAKIAQIYVSHNDKRSSFFEQGPLVITTRVQNLGNVHFQPHGTLQITNMLGKNVQVSQFNPQNRNVLPGSIRRFNNTLDKSRLFGRYVVHADVVYGSNNQIASATYSFWVIPYKLILSLILMIGILVFVFKQYNRYIISKASGKHGKKTNKR